MYSKPYLVFLGSPLFDAHLGVHECEEEPVAEVGEVLGLLAIICYQEHL